MSQVNAFDVLKEMGERNLDIRMSRCADNLVNIRKVRAGGEVTIGVDDTTRQIMMEYALGSKKHNAVFLVFNNEQFNQVKAELEAASYQNKSDSLECVT
jgi:hypothetical protein